VAREAAAIRAATSAKAAAAKAPNDEAAAAKSAELAQKADTAKRAKEAAINPPGMLRKALETVVSTCQRRSRIGYATTAAQEAAASNCPVLWMRQSE
jgi:hypothetical protein